MITKKMIKIDNKIFFIRTKNMSKKKFLKQFYVKNNTYLYNLYCRLYSYIAGNAINLFKEYKLYYSKEYSTFKIFLSEHYNIPDNIIESFDNRKSFYKYVDIGNEQPLYSLMMNKTIQKVVKDFMGDFKYEN